MPGRGSLRAIRRTMEARTLTPEAKRLQKKVRKALNVKARVKPGIVPGAATTVDLEKSP